MTRRKRREMERQRQIAIHRKVNSRKKMCDNKEAYFDEQHAMEWAHQYNKGLHRDDPLPYRAYHCPNCNRWHLTTTPKKDTTPKKEMIADEV